MVKFRDILDGVNDIQDTLNNNTIIEPDYHKGLISPEIPSADGNGLPYSKIRNNREGQFKRNIITFFVPEFGLVRMYINPQNIVVSNKKLINRQLTKGGFTLQYWGEDLTTIKLSGTTGSSGVEGINLLYEIYRAEQYAFDSVGLTLAANNVSADLSNNLSNAASNLVFNGLNNAFDSNIAGELGLLAGGLLGIGSNTNPIAGKNLPSLASLAFTVEMYHNGWVYRGFFDDMSFTESAENFFMNYDITFIATQRRGYRVNHFPWNKSANNGPSSYSNPYSYDSKVKGQ